jgi:hypothetical protein
MSSPGELPVLFGGRLRLQQEASLGDLLDVGVFAGEVPFSIATCYSEPSGQKQHKNLIPVSQ